MDLPVELPGDSVPPSYLKSEIERELAILRRVVKYDRQVVETLSRIDTLVAKLPESQGAGDALAFEAYVMAQANQIMSSVSGKIALMPPQQQATWVTNTLLAEIISTKLMIFEGLIATGVLSRNVRPRPPSEETGGGLIQ